MSTQVLPGPLGELRAASTAGGGTALSTTAVVIGLWPGTEQVMITPRNFATGVVAEVSTNPYVLVLKTTDALVAAANLSDFSATVQDNTTSTVALGALDTAANKNYLYVGSARPISGINVTVGTANTVASVLTANYWNGAWTSLALTDGTIATGATFGQTGAITWTTPTGWKTTALLDAGDTAQQWGVARHGLYWVRFQVSVALASGTTIQSVYSTASDTHWAELLTLVDPFTFACDVNLGGISSISAKMNAGTGNLIVNCAAGHRFP